MLSRIVSSDAYAYLTLIVGILFAWALAYSLDSMYKEAMGKRRKRRR